MNCELLFVKWEGFHQNRSKIDPGCEVRVNYQVMIVTLLFVPTLFAQQKRPFEHEAVSTVEYKNENRSESVEIKNVIFDLVGPAIPGRSVTEHLVLRKTTRTKQVIDEVGMEATTIVEAWPSGVDLKEKPIYSITVQGVDPLTLNNQLIVVSRGLEDVGWWSIYKLGNGGHLFDTYLPVTQFSISQDVQTLRYVGLEVPPDDAADARLKAPNVVGVLTYASAERVIREALITCDDPKLAKVLRSYFDATRTIAFTGGSLRLSISQNSPLRPQTVSITVPVARDDLDFSRSQTPAGLHINAWKR
jgi:hypothetical protein